MRNFVKNSSLALAAVLALSACGNKNTPETTAIEFYQALTSLDFAKATTLGDESAAKGLEFFKGLSAGATAEDIAKAKELAKNIKTAKCTVTGETAKCTVCCNEEGKDSDAFTLVKQGGKWVVSMKEELQQLEALQAMQQAAEAMQEAADTMEEAAETEAEEVETDNAE